MFNKQCWPVLPSLYSFPSLFLQLCNFLLSVCECSDLKDREIPLEQTKLLDLNSTEVTEAKMFHLICKSEERYMVVDC